MTRRGAPADYRVAIPSYQRPGVLCTKTIPMLLDGGVTPDRITVFLDEHDGELPGYLRQLPAGIDAHVTPPRGIAEARTTAFNFYPPGTPVALFDDDVSHLIKAIDAKLTRPIKDVDGFLRTMFFETAARDLWVWGLSPTPNAFYMTPGRITTGLRFCVGTCLGVFTRPGHPVQQLHVEVKEDYELSVQAWWWDGGVVRADGAATVAAHYTAGGCSDLRAAGVEVRSVEYLLATWPGLIRRNDKRKSPYPEVKLTPKARTAGHPLSTPPPGRRRVEA